MANYPRIIFSGMIASDPHQGGATWAVLQYVLGLHDLGCDVYFIEPLDESSLLPDGVELAASKNAAYFHSVVSDFGLQSRAALLLKDSTQTVGLDYDQLCTIASRADVLINVSGMLADPRLVERIPVRAYLDLDPAFIQLWHCQGIEMGFDRHTHFVTIGRALGQPECMIPTCDRSWITTNQPIVLKHWPAVPTIPPPCLTTIGNWRGYGSVEHQGVFYGQKAHSMRELLPLAMRCKTGLRLAMAVHPEEHADLKALSDYGWTIVDPKNIVQTPENYRDFIQNSWAEFGVTKQGYVTSRCGWFSDRSVCYLASGRPVLAQETGFSHYLPTGEGLFSFSTIDEFQSHVQRLLEDYQHHARAARVIAEQHFDSRKVLQRLLAEIGIPL